MKNIITLMLSTVALCSQSASVTFAQTPAAPSISSNNMIHNDSAITKMLNYGMTMYALMIGAAYYEEGLGESELAGMSIYPLVLEEIVSDKELMNYLKPQTKGYLEAIYPKEKEAMDKASKLDSDDQAGFNAIKKELADTKAIIAQQFPEAAAVYSSIEIVLQRVTDELQLNLFIEKYAKEHQADFQANNDKAMSSMMQAMAKRIEELVDSM